MAKPKRQRQRDSRSRQAAAAAARRKAAKRRNIGVALFLIIFLVLGLAALSTGGDDDEEAAPRPVQLPPLPPGATITGDTPCPSVDGTAARTTRFAKAPPNCIDPAKGYTARIDTNRGPITVALDAAQRPVTVNNFVVLARYHFFDGISFHRIVPNLRMQAGDPDQTGTGGPGYQLPDELTPPPTYQVGSIAMANAGPNTAGSQFFLVTAEAGAQQLNSQPLYAVFGQVTEGLELLRQLGTKGIPGREDTDPGAGLPTEVITITSVTVTES